LLLGGGGGEVGEEWRSVPLRSDTVLIKGKRLNT
jgi:hypothetical protein